MRKINNKFLLTVALFFSIILLSGCGSKPAKYNPNESLGKQINYTITGIEAGAGIMSSTQKAMKAYGLNDDKWQLQTSSTAAMTSTLGKAIKITNRLLLPGGHRTGCSRSTT